MHSPPRRSARVQVPWLLDSVADHARAHSACHHCPPGPCALVLASCPALGVPPRANAAGVGRASAAPLSTSAAIPFVDHSGHTRQPQSAFAPHRMRLTLAFGGAVLNVTTRFVLVADVSFTPYVRGLRG